MAPSKSVWAARPNLGRGSKTPRERKSRVEVDDKAHLPSPIYISVYLWGGKCANASIPVSGWMLTEEYNTKVASSQKNILLY